MKKIFGYVIVAVISAAAASYWTYQRVDARADAQKNAAEQEIQQLEALLEKVKKGEVLAFGDYVLGQKIGDFTVATISTASSDQVLSEDNLFLEFTVAKTIHGTYLLDQGVEQFIPDAATAEVLPVFGNTDAKTFAPITLTPGNPLGLPIGDLDSLTTHQEQQVTLEMDGYTYIVRGDMVYREMHHAAVE